MWRRFRAGNHREATRDKKTSALQLLLSRWCKGASLNLMRPPIAKEPRMRYKTIVLELFQQHSEIHNRLRSNRSLLQTVELYARELKISHEAWTNHLSRVKPGSDRIQIASETLEIALDELGSFLRSEPPPADKEEAPGTIAIVVVRNRTPSV